jgi:hypothetical protein
MAEEDLAQVLEVGQHWTNVPRFLVVGLALVEVEQARVLPVILLHLPLCHQSDCLSRDRLEEVVVVHGRDHRDDVGLL